jgi:hypothetical protein
VVIKRADTREQRERVVRAIAGTIGPVRTLRVSRALGRRELCAGERASLSPANPASVIAQVEGSGTEGAKALIVALPVLNAAVKNPDVNRVSVRLDNQLSSI